MMHETTLFATRPGEDGEHITFCRLCEAHCGLIARVRGGKIVQVKSDPAHPVSQGHLCVKGPAMAQVTHDPDRVLVPLRRCGGPGEFEPVEWDEALDDIAGRLCDITATHGPDALGLYVGNPSAFGVLHATYTAMFSAAFGSAKRYGPLHADTAGKMLACELIYGSSTRFTFPDLDKADMLVIIGANPVVSHMSLVTAPRFRDKLDVIAERNGVVVIDPRLTETARRYEHVPIMPDTDAWLLSAMLNVIFTENLHSAAFDPRIEGWQELRHAVSGMSPELASTVSKVPAAEIVSLARRFAAAPRAACYGRVGTNRGSYSTLVNILIEALNIVTGRFATDGGWIFGEEAFAAGELPAALKYGARKSRISGIPSIIGRCPAGELADDILVAGEGRTHALIVDSGNPVMAYPDQAKTERALEQLDLLVSIDFYVTETSRHATYILPATTLYEREDLNNLWLSTSPEPCLQYTAAVIPPEGEARNEYDIYNAILRRTGRPELFATLGPAPDLLEVAGKFLAAGETGCDLPTLKANPHGIRLADHVNPARSWERISNDDGHIRLWGDVIAAEFQRLLTEELPPAEGLRLVGRRMLRSLNSWMHNNPKVGGKDCPTLLIHPDDAEARGIRSGDEVLIVSKSGEILAQAEISDQMIAGAVSYPHGFGHSGGWRVANAQAGSNVNALASSDPADWEQVSGACLLDGIPVEIMTLAKAG